MCKFFLTVYDTQTITKVFANDVPGWLFTWYDHFNCIRQNFRGWQRIVLWTYHYKEMQGSPLLVRMRHRKKPEEHGEKSSKVLIPGLPTDLLQTATWESNEIQSGDDVERRTVTAFSQSRCKWSPVFSYCIAKCFEANEVSHFLHQNHFISVVSTLDILAFYGNNLIAKKRKK